mmetsp:Transcript_124012/g.246945  ORF Transcript_124012/g.246945 Transcript_124012/m.246945 type:complete len:210 (-) Transcript_124012:47-676(-)
MVFWKCTQCETEPAPLVDTAEVRIGMSKTRPILDVDADVRAHQQNEEHRWLEAEKERLRQEELQFHEELLAERKEVERNAYEKEAERKRKIGMAVRLEALRMCSEEEDRERKAEVDAFCSKHGFQSATTPRKSTGLFSGGATTYALHVAAEHGEARVVEALLNMGASPSQRNSSGLTAAEVAARKNVAGSHDVVLRLLNSDSGKCSEGA